jgi:N6-adenosine-specific RNA methylase IME4
VKAEIRIDGEFKRLIAPLSEDEYDQLETNIAREGCRDPIVVWDGILLDGHNRYDICNRIGRPFKVLRIILPDRTAARIWVRWNQLGRRNLTDDQRAMQVAGLVDDLAKQSKRQRAVNARAAVVERHPTKTKPDSRDAVSRESGPDKTSVRTKTSKRARVSERKVKQAQSLRKRAPDLAAKVATGELPLAEAVRQTKPKIRADKLAEAIWPEGKHGVILADPPWKPDDGLLDPTRRIENQYPTMTLDELIALKPKVDALALADCVLLLWATTQKVSEATSLIAAWGFTVKSGAVWVKNSIGMGYWFRGRHELLLLATRGTPMTPLEANRPDSVITADRSGHSEKPAVVYRLIEEMFPTIPKVEIFARAQREGWSIATNETQLRSA